MSHIEIHENRSYLSTIIGVLLICMALASLLTIKGMSRMPLTVTIKLLEENVARARRFNSIVILICPI